jgi:hypothetical protein
LYATGELARGQAAGARELGVPPFSASRRPGPGPSRLAGPAVGPARVA